MLIKGLPNACKLMCFDRNINGNRNVKVFECDYLLVHWFVKLTLVVAPKIFGEIQVALNSKESSHCTYHETLLV